MACGLPVILTPNTGASDLVHEGVSGSIVPIRDSNSIVEKALFWRERIMANAHTKGLSGVDLGSLAYLRFRQRLEKVFNRAI
jgi:glycosyltransferase involved in cell wall biosynthesis